MESAKANFDIILQVGAGTGLLYLLRWFWWRITAWCEVVAMASSFAVSVALLILKRNAGVNMNTYQALLITIAVTTLCWMLTAFLGPQTDRATLIAFYKKVRPFGPGWRRIREEAGISESEAAATHENIPLALLGWSTGCAVIWSSLFTVGNILYGRYGLAALLFAVFLLTGFILLWVVKRLWANGSEAAPAKSAHSSMASV
jgi:hypothetical protein